MARQKTTATLRKNAWKALSLWYRQSQANHAGNVTCWTCGAVHHWKEIHSAHGIGGRHNAVLFDLEVIRPGCYHCNVGLRGNYQVFVTKLIQENGMDWWLKKLEDSKRIVKFTRGELLQMIEDYKSKLSVLERSQKWSTSGN